MVNHWFNSILVIALSFTLSACVTQNFENGETPVVQNQASRDDMAATRISLGLGYLKMGNMPQAKQNLEKAKKFAPEMVQVYTAFAHYYETVGEHKLTISSYEKALTLKSDDADTLNNYGVYLCRQNQIVAAEQQFLKAIAVPTYLLVAKSYENLASCFLQVDNFEKAESYLSKAILHSPSSASTLLQMVRLQYAMGQYPQAKVFEQRFEKVTRRFTPQSLALAYKLHVKLGQKRTAKNYGTMLVKMYPQSWEAKQYLLNELELIDADNLAKRFQLTKVKIQDNKPKKRIVKLSPKKKVAGQIKAPSSAKVAQLNTPKSNLSVANKGKKEQKLIKTVAVPIPSSKSGAIASTQVISDVLSMPASLPASLEKKPGKAASKPVSSSSASSAEIATAIIATTPETAVKEKKMLVLSAPEKFDADNIKVSDNAQAHLQITQTENTLQTRTPTVEVSQEKVAQEKNLPVVLGAKEAAQAENNSIEETLQEELKQEDRKIVNVAKKPAPIVEDIITPQAIIVVAPDSKALEAEAQQAKAQDIKIAEVTKQSVAPEESQETSKHAPATQELLSQEESSEIKKAPQKAKKNTVKSPRTHTVVSGDTLFGISVQYNVKIKALRRWNKLSKKRKIRINDKLIIENPDVVTKIND